MKSVTKKEELRILRKFTDAIHGENSKVCHVVMQRIIAINHYDCLNDLRESYKKLFLDNDLKIIIKTP